MFLFGMEMNLLVIVGMVKGFAALLGWLSSKSKYKWLSMLTCVMVPS